MTRYRTIVDCAWREHGIVNLFTPVGNVHLRDLRKAPLLFSDRHYPRPFPWWITASHYQVRFLRRGWRVRGVGRGDA